MGFTYCLLLYIEVNFTNFYALGIGTPPSVGMPKLEVDLSALGLLVVRLQVCWSDFLLVALCDALYQSCFIYMSCATRGY